MLEKPSELLLYGPVEEGGLGLHHVQRLLKILISLKHILFFLCILFSFSAYVVCCFCPSVCSIHSILFSTLHISYVMFCYVMFLFLIFQSSHSIYFALYTSFLSSHYMHVFACIRACAPFSMHLLLCISFYLFHSMHLFLCILFCFKLLNNC